MHKSTGESHLIETESKNHPSSTDPRRSVTSIWHRSLSSAATDTKRSPVRRLILFPDTMRHVVVRHAGPSGPSATAGIQIATTIPRLQNSTTGACRPRLSRYLHGVNRTISNCARSHMYPTTKDAFLLIQSPVRNTLRAGETRPPGCRGSGRAGARRRLRRDRSRNASRGSSWRSPRRSP